MVTHRGITSNTQDSSTSSTIHMGTVMQGIMLLPTNSSSNTYMLATPFRSRHLVLYPQRRTRTSKAQCTMNAECYPPVTAQGPSLRRVMGTISSGPHGRLHSPVVPVSSV